MKQQAIELIRTYFSCKKDWEQTLKTVREGLRAIGFYDLPWYERQNLVRTAKPGKRSTEKIILVTIYLFNLKCG